MWRGMPVSFRDMLFLLVFAYLIIGAIALANVHRKAEDKEKQQGMAPPGSVVVELWWQKDRDSDVDLWVQAPGDIPVGYSAKSGTICNLVRDDLGHTGDMNSMNYETTFCRGRWPGEYVVNAHEYRSWDMQFPIHCRAKISTADKQGNVVPIIETEFDLEWQGQETTIVRFRLDDQGHLVAGSENRIHKALRSGTKRPQ